MPRVLPHGSSIPSAGRVNRWLVGHLVMTERQGTPAVSQPKSRRRAGSCSSTASRWRAGKGSSRRRPAPVGRPWTASCIARAAAATSSPSRSSATSSSVSNGSLTRAATAASSSTSSRRATQAWWSGPEIQVLDNAVHRDGKDPITSAGSNYAVHPPARDVTKPIGEWNTVRLLVKGPHVEHWLNGVKIVEYEMWSADWEARVKASKFGKIPMYGKAASADTSRSRITATRCGTATSRCGRCNQAPDLQRPVPAAGGPFPDLTLT